MAEDDKRDADKQRRGLKRNNQESTQSGGISSLTALMEANNKSASEVEKDGRNTRRHLLEIKKINVEMLNVQKSTLLGFEKFFEIMDTRDLQGQEESNERLTLFQEIKDSLSKIAENTSSSGAGGDGGNRRGGGFLSGLGVGAIGAVGGIATLGLAIPAFFGAMQAGEYGLDALNTNFNFENIKKAALGFTDIITEIPKEGLITLGGLLAVATFSGNPLKTALGFSLLGAAIPGFLGGLQVGEYGLDALNSDFNFENIKKAVAGFVGVIGEVPNNLDGAKIAALLGTGILIGATKGVKAAGGVAAGMAAMGLGISGFFGGFAVGEYAISKLGDIDYTGIKSAVSNFDETIQSMSGEGEAKFIALLGAGGLLGVLGGAGKSFNVAASMTALGAGIGGFFTGFAGMAKLGGMIGADGSSAKTLLTNFSEGIAALDQDAFKSLAAVMAIAGVAALFGGAGATAVGIGSALIGVIGAGIASFFVAFDGMAALGGVLGVNGSSTKLLMSNLADGLNALGEVNVGESSMKAVAGGLMALGPALLVFLGTKGLGGLIDTASDIGGGIKKGFNWLIGGEGTTPLLEEIAQSIEPITELNKGNAISEFNDFVDNLFILTSNPQAIDKASNSWTKFGLALGGVASYKEDLKSVSESLSAVKDDVFGDVSINTQTTPLIANLRVNNLSAENALLKLPQESSGGVLAVSQQGGNNIRTGDTVVITQTNKDLIDDSLNQPRG